ncbi:conserved protein of unknown function [Nitrospira japonica]|uniref:Lipoprotein n=1 Tax=Nitrospira japonica TaxID=1325564 RepID=A0A1W1I9H5_9BACT|nr:hypothetical protein [Nitrospira japonica]SLM49635.1 conserved protein of unknown function [Nitrospira japonica]
MVVAAVALVIGSACSGAKVTTQKSGSLPRYQVRTLVLLPFETLNTPQIRDAGNRYMSTPRGAQASDISVGVPMSAEPQLHQTMVVPAYAADKITQLFWVRLRNLKGVTILSPAPSSGSKTSTHQAGDLPQVLPEQAAADAAKKVGADAAVVGQVSVYQERVGSRLGANPPASVGFEIKAVAADGHVLWAGNYFERQKPMTEDFSGFIHHGWGFVTVDELTRYGVEELMKVFPFGSTGD